MTNKEAIFELIKYRRRLEEDPTIIFGCGAFDAEPFDMAIEALEEVQKHEETFEWCHDCKEYDQEGHCCHRWSKRIWETIAELRLEHKNGEWIPYPISDCTYECSGCGYIRDAYLLDTGNFCPNCGADMRKEE